MTCAGSVKRRRARALGGLVLASVALGCEGAPRAVATDPSGAEEAPAPSGSTGSSGSSEGEIVEIDLSRGAPESMESGGLFGLPATRTFVGLVRAIERAKKNEEAKGFFVNIGDARLGYARSEEIGRLLADLRKTKKPVVCHANTLGNTSTWMALRGCDRIWLSPAGDVDTVGIAGQVVYLKGALDKLKVHADFMQVGKYKSFAEMITREGPTDEARASLVGALSSMRSAWLSDVKAVSEKAERSMEKGPWTAPEAKELGLIHEVGYEANARHDAKQRGNAEAFSPGFGPNAQVGGKVGLVEIVRLLTGADERSGGRPHIAVVPLVGGIAMAGGGLFSDGGISLRAARKTLRNLAEDESAKAVVLRIDSPGGSALASDLLWYEIRQLRQKKKVIASIGEMAASGGYYLAVAADKILAERTSIVGSIGVVGGKITVGETAAELGIHSETFPASPEPNAAARAAYMSVLAPWDAASRERVRHQMRSIYDVFIDRVAQGRGLEVSEVEKHAQGRIWTGAQGKDKKLVDELGGLHRAIELARELGELDENAPVVVSGGRESLLEALMLEEDASSSEIAAAVARYERRLPRPLGSMMAAVKPFVHGVEPLLTGEKVLAAMPYALIVR